MEAGKEAHQGSGPGIAHEIRTHLTTILGYGELLTVEDLTPPQREAAEAIVVAGTRILRLIDDLPEQMG